MAAISSFSPSGSRSPTPIFDSNVHEVRVGKLFCWDHLSRSLNIYLMRLKDDWDDLSEMPEGLKGFCDELEDWLANPQSAEANVAESLEHWKNRVDALNLEKDLDLPEIVIVEIS